MTSAAIQIDYHDSNPIWSTALDKPSVDLIYITCGRIEYVKQTLPALFASTEYPFRLTIVDNASTDGTAEYIYSLKEPRIARKIFNAENLALTVPTNEFWKRSAAKYVGKIDDDILVPKGWIERLLEPLEECPSVAVVGCFYFNPTEDFEYEKCKHNIIKVGRYQLFLQKSVGGACHLARREILAKAGAIPEGLPMVSATTTYQKRLLRGGYLVGYRYPLVVAEHLDDPRSGKSLLGSTYFKYAKDLWAKRGIELNGPEDIRKIGEYIHEAGVRAFPSDIAGGRAKRLVRRLRRILGIIPG